MEENLSTNNVADDALIADLSARTEASFTQYSRVFLLWGIIALVESIFLLIADYMRYAYTKQVNLNHETQNPEMILSHFQNNQFPALLSDIGFPLMLVGWCLVYLFIARTVKSSGMSKELMRLWVWSVVVTLLPTIFMIVYIIMQNAVQYFLNSPLAPTQIRMNLIHMGQFLWFVFSLMMMVTGTLTRTKMYLWFALLLALIGMIVQSGIFAYPVTFILMGGYLEWKRRKIPQI